MKNDLSWLSEVIAWILIIAIIVFEWVLAKKSNLLRDDISNETDFINNAKTNNRYTTTISNFTGTQILNEIPRTYSLARTQFALWTAVISCSYIYISLFMHCPLKGVNNTALILMGISIGTAGFASIIDQSQSDAPRHQNAPSHGFLTDILSDENGVSIHRMQNVIWTVIAMIIYLYKVYHTNLTGCQLPELDTTLIILTGISSAGYLGLKVNENAK